MSIRVHAIDPSLLDPNVVHTYAKGYSVRVLPDGTLLVEPRPNVNDPGKVLGAYPPGRWNAVYDDAEMVVQP